MHLSDLLLYCGYFFLVAGAFFVFTGALGLFRLPEVITRVHAAGVVDGFGACLILLGLAFLSESFGVVVKLLLLVLLICVTSPTACHALLQAAFHIPQIKKRWQRFAQIKGKRG